LPGDQRQAQWSELDLDTAEWNIPSERKKRMQQWSDYLDGLKGGAKILPFAKKTG
jgi:hypothetical protein